MAEKTAEGVRLTLEDARRLVVDVLSKHGADAASAEAASDNLATAEGDGCKSHGLFRLPAHVALMAAGVANGAPSLSLERTAPGVLMLEADGAFASRAHAEGLGALSDLAAEQGVAALAIRRCVHIGALWPEVEALAARGLAAIAVTSSPPYVAPAGGRRSVFGTNPMAFAFARESAAPLVWDQASAAMARGEIQIHARDGHSLPEGAGIDSEGRPTTDPQAILGGGAQLPFGGYKGGAIALMVDLLAGPLIGEVTSLEAGVSATASGPQLGGELIVAFAPWRLGAAAPAAGSGTAGAESLFAAILEQEGTRLPGDRRRANRRRSAEEGVVIPAALHAEIMDLL